MESGEWRKIIISQLQARNRQETAAFQDLISFQSKLFDNVNTLKTENLQLTLVNERIRFSGTESVISGAGNVVNEKIQALEQKILVQQEELTSLHRRKGESAQLIINLNARVHDLEKQLQGKDITISENTALIASLRAEIQMYENSMTELQGLNQVLGDEHQALQIAFAAIEAKLRKVQDENRSLVERLIKYKAKDVDKLNEENDTFLKKKGEKVRKELEEAAREGGSRSSGSSNEDKALDSLHYYSAPSKAATRFDAHDGEINAVKWSPTGRIVATGGADRKLKLWDVTKCTVENKGSLVGSNQGVMSVDFDSTGAYIVGASNDFASRVWTVGDQRLRMSLSSDQIRQLKEAVVAALDKAIAEMAATAPTHDTGNGGTWQGRRGRGRRGGRGGRGWRQGYHPLTSYFSDSLYGGGRGGSGGRSTGPYHGNSYQWPLKTWQEQPLQWVPAPTPAAPHISADEIKNMINRQKAAEAMALQEREARKDAETERDAMRRVLMSMGLAKDAGRRDTAREEREEGEIN